MFIGSDFKDSIDPITLKFRKPKYEARFSAEKEKLIENSTLWKVIAGIGIFMSVAFTLLMKNHYKKGEYLLSLSAFITVIIGDIGVFAEYLCFKYKQLRIFRGLGVSLGVYFSCSYYASRVLSAPSFLPGYF